MPKLKTHTFRHHREKAVYSFYCAVHIKATPLCLERDSVIRLITPFLFEETKTRPKYSVTNL